MNQCKTITHYDPHQFLNILMQYLKVNSDQALSKRLKISLKVIKNIRSGRFPIAGSLLMCIEEATGISVSELRCWLGDRRMKWRLNLPQAQPALNQMPDLG